MGQLKDAKYLVGETGTNAVDMIFPPKSGRVVKQLS